ncbi:unnamed protein product [Phytomonas sp. EM1]|nr:unnamed protein product [Phytomonas sp. EM1]|eukprot:CCW60765.1 unnamed protein product [Phytomonas sp. isolate EM1]
MSFHFASAPLNFQRFLDLTRSGSRSLSPENELRQMVVSSASSSHIKQDDLLSSSSVYPSNSKSNQLHQTSYGHLTGSTTSLKASSSSVEDDHFDGTGNPLLKYTAEIREDYLNSCGFAEEECLKSTNNEVMNELVEEFKTFSLWQYGSPFYYPVTDEFYCWNLHPLQPKYKHEYHGMEGISCDFCGYTEWLTTTDEPESNSKSLDKPKTSSRQSCGTSKIEVLHTPTQHESSRKRVKEEETALEAPKSRTIFHHCSVCRADLCAACIADIRSDDRYHAPCRQCLRCKNYLSHQQGAAHRCRGSKDTARAVFVKKEEAGGAKIPVPDFPRGGVCIAPEEDLHSTSQGHTGRKPATRKRTKAVDEAHLLTDSPRAIRTSGVKKSNSDFPVLSSAGAELIPKNIPSAPLKPGSWMEAGYVLALARSNGKTKPQRRSPATRTTPGPESGWEVCFTASTAEETAQAERILKAVPIQPVHQKVNALHEILYIFKTTTRLAAENCARLAREAGLLVSLRKL